MQRSDLRVDRIYAHTGEGLVTVISLDDSLRDARTGEPIGVVVRAHSDGEYVLTSADALSETEGR